MEQWLAYNKGKYSVGGNTTMAWSRERMKNCINQYESGRDNTNHKYEHLYHAHEGNNNFEWNIKAFGNQHTCQLTNLLETVEKVAEIVINLQEQNNKNLMILRQEQANSLTLLRQISDAASKLPRGNIPSGSTSPASPGTPVVITQEIVLEYEGKIDYIINCLERLTGVKYNPNWAVLRSRKR